MKQIAACLLVAVGLGAAGYCRTRRSYRWRPRVLTLTGRRTLLLTSSRTGISKNHTFANPALDCVRKWRIGHEAKGAISAGLLV